MKLRALPRWFKRRIGYARLLCLALLIGFAALRIADPVPVEEIRVRTFDAFQRIDPRKKTARPVTIVDIDDKSLEKLGQWPWPRTRIADLVTELTRLGAVVIAFDAVFSEPDRLNPALAADTFRNLDEETRARLRALPSNDQVFADAIKASRVVLGESGLPEESAPLDKTLPVTGLAMLGEEPQRFMFDFPGLLRNVPVLEHAAAGRGLFTIKPERDGIVRRVPMIMQAQGQTMPSLTFEMLRVATGSGTILIKAEKAGIKSLGIKGLQIPTDHNGQLWVHYARNDASIYVSAINVLEKNVAPDMIVGKLVLIGTSAVGLHDIKTTPVSRAMPGVEIHAQVLESTLTGEVVSTPIYGIVVEFATAFLFGLLVIAFAPAVRADHAVCPRRGVRIRADRNIRVFLRAAPSADRFHLSPDVDDGDLSHADLFEFRARAGAAPADPLGLRPVSVAGPGRATGAVAGKARARRRGARDDHHVFRHPRLHLDLGELQERPAGPHRVDQSLPHAADQHHPQPQGHHRQIYGRRHHGVLERAARRQGPRAQRLRGGAGDAGAVDELNEAREQEAKEAGRPFIPLNRHRAQYRHLRGRQYGLGPALRLFGHRRQRQLASRLEGQSKEYGFPIIIGSRTALAVKDRFAILELDFIMVKGKKEPEVIYAIAGREDTAQSGRFQRLRNLTIEMLACYRGRDWEGALAAIERGRKTDEANSLELLYRLYEARIRGYLEHPPPQDWNGAFALLTK